MCWWSAACRRHATTPTMDTLQHAWQQSQRATRCVHVHAHVLWARMHMHICAGRRTVWAAARQACSRSRNSQGRHRRQQQMHNMMMCAPSVCYFRLSKLLLVFDFLFVFRRGGGVQVTLQYCLWDQWKTVTLTEPRRLLCLAGLVGQLLASCVLPLSSLKAVSRAEESLPVVFRNHPGFWGGVGGGVIQDLPTQRPVGRLSATAAVVSDVQLCAVVSRPCVFLVP